jgi:SUMO ligase MMS21 Smc5/6 complex component
MTAGLHADKQSLKERLQNAEARALKAEEELKALKASLKRCSPPFRLSSRSSLRAPLAAG